ncbi:MAG: hypothetical protein ACXW3J_09620 [Methylocystis sp.]
MFDDYFGVVELVFSFGVVIGQERFPITWNHVIDKESLKVKMLGRFSSKKSVNFFGTCPRRLATVVAGEGKKTPA